MQIKEMKIGELIPYENNPRHNENAVDAVAESIRRFGAKVPIIIDRNNVIVAGHTRRAAAIKLGMETFPVIMADDLTDEQIRAFRLADNKTGELAEWDFDRLREELEALKDIDMGAFGFEDLLEEAGKLTIDDVDEDDFDEESVPKEEPKAKLGDIYQLGDHRLMCGDATRKEDVEELLDGQKAKILLTDPPYGINIVSGGGTVGTGNWPLDGGGTGTIGGAAPLSFGNGRRRRSPSLQEGGGGNKQPEEAGGGSEKTPKENRISPDAVVPSKVYRKIIGDETTETAKKGYFAAKDLSENQILFGGNYFTDFCPPSRCWLVWDKQNTGNFADAELAWTSFEKSVKLYRFMWNGLAREGSRKAEGVTRVHPTQKPVGLFGRIIVDFSEDGDIILDTFGGSGSTMIACEQTRRKCFMMELDPHYVDVIIARWEEFTGKKAELIRSGNQKQMANT